jgi:EAL domain-containing protein (putative c-di-GMP-specific phosphodiesterase class I)
MHSPLGQGYLFSRPVTREQLQLLLASEQPLAESSVAAALEPPRD